MRRTDRPACPAPRERPCESGQGVLEVRFGVARRDRVVQGARLVVERERPSTQHPDPCLQRLELPTQILVPQLHQFLRVRGGLGPVQLHDQRTGLGADLVERQRPPFGVGAPRLRTVVRVDIVAVVLPHRQHQLHVAFGDVVHVGVRLSLSGHDQGHDHDGEHEMAGVDHGVIVLRDELRRHPFEPHAADRQQTTGHRLEQTANADTEDLCHCLFGPMLLSAMRLGKPC